MTKSYLLAVALASLCALPTDAAFACRFVRMSASGEPLCITTSDGPGQPYTDARTDRRRSRAELLQRRIEHHRRMEEMRRGGTMMGGILVSPHVPGSAKDKAWQEERRRLGFAR